MGVDSATACTSVVLLLTTTLKISRDGLPIWKGSALAALFHGLEDESTGKAPGGVSVSSVAEMNAVAEQQDVRLVKGDERWKLVVLG